MKEHAMLGLLVVTTLSMLAALVAFIALAVDRSARTRAWRQIAAERRRMQCDRHRRRPPEVPTPAPGNTDATLTHGDTDWPPPR